MTSDRDAVSCARVVSAGCLAVAILAVAAAVESYLEASAFAESHRDRYRVESTEARFAPVIARFPPATVLGLITGLDRTEIRDYEALVVVRYAIAPRQVVLVDRETRPEWAVGAFAGNASAAGAALGYNVSEDMGNGIVLFRRALR